VAPWEQALDTFVRARGPALIRYAFLLTGDRTAAEDLVQDALVKTFTRGRASTDVVFTEAYVRRVMVTRSIDGFRSGRRFAAVRHLVATEPAQNGPESATISPECKAYWATWKDLFPKVTPSAKPTAWPTAWPTAKPTFTIDPTVKTWFDNMPAACKTFVPFGKYFDPKADRALPPTPVVKPAVSPKVPALMPAWGGKWPVGPMPVGPKPVAPAGAGTGNVSAPRPGGAFPGAPVWGH
jgi:hypothetical protein